MSLDAEAAALEKQFWATRETRHLEAFQAASRTRERLSTDARHRFIVVIPLADRPQQLAACLDSLHQLSRLYGFGGKEAGIVSVLIADDSKEPENIQRHQQLATRYHALGLATDYFGLLEQAALRAEISPDHCAALTGVLGVDEGAHKGASAMRNLVYLKLAAQADEHTLCYFIDSDQTFQVRLAMPNGERDVYAIDYFYQLDRIFSATDTLLLTGKVVGDPPVSPAVMAANFLADVVNFLQTVAKINPQDCCAFHTTSASANDAAYHDMARLFGFEENPDVFSYACPLRGQHSNADVLKYFASHLHGFFHGEHPTRKSRYEYADPLASLQAARTVYTGNYCFRAQALKYFIPFASLKLRMAGPVLGRILKAELGDRFVSVNLPMLHARTLNAGDAYEFRPGVAEKEGDIDLSGELERQFYGDVMLFSIGKLTALGYPKENAENYPIAEIIQTTQQEMAGLYAEKRALVMARLKKLAILMRDTACSETVHTQLQSFVDNIAKNFGNASPGYAKIEQHAAQRQTEMIKAVAHYGKDKKTWEAALQRGWRCTP